jgi:tRNA threonylcarbamoyladenosine biosynthesis protein TsaE
MEKYRVLKTEEDTKRLGEELARDLGPGSVLALSGDLGAGKTTLTKAIAKGLGVSENLTSPTFTVVCEYDSGRLPFYHFDVYRVHDEDELFEIGFDEYLHRGGVCVIEWADLIEDMLPADAVRVRLSYGDGENERICEIE